MQTVSGEVVKSKYSAEIGGGGAERKQDTATLVCALIIFMEWRGKKEKGLIQPAAYQNSPGNPRARSL